MPNRRKQNRRRRGGRRKTTFSTNPLVSVVDRSPNIRVPGTTLATFAFSASSFVQLNVDPYALASRITSISSNFILYRFVELRLTFSNNTGSTGVHLVLSYEPATVSGGATTFAQLVEGSRSSAWVWPTDSVPSCLILPFKTLVSQTQFKWWDVAAGGTNPKQGYLCMASSANCTSNVDVRVDYVVEFSQPVYTGRESDAHSGYITVEEMKIPDPVTPEGLGRVYPVQIVPGPQPVSRTSSLVRTSVPPR